jgi:rRNA maturation protein Nop10
MNVLAKALATIRRVSRELRDHVFTWPPRCPDCGGEMFLLYQLVADDCDGGFLIYMCPQCGVDVPWSPTCPAGPPRERPQP